MDLLHYLADFVLHLDTHLADIIARYGTGTYLILFLIVFCETGLVVTPFLPGDSLLFAAGTFAGLGALNPYVLLVLLMAAALCGDNVNYWVGRYIGPRAFSGAIPWLRQDYLARTEAFYDRHGGKTVIIARFIPIIRTFAPFVAGVGRMRYARFLSFSVGGAALWVGLFIFGGYLFGNIPVVRRNFSAVIVAIILISVLPVVVEAVKARRRAG
jgi:membrane-associated protein